MHAPQKGVGLSKQFKCGCFPDYTELKGKWKQNWTSQENWERSEIEHNKNLVEDTAALALSVQIQTTNWMHFLYNIV